MPERVFETVSEFYVGLMKVRVWRNHATAQETALSAEIKEILPDYQASPMALAFHYAGLPNVSAVEVRKDQNSKAILIYNDWP